MRSEHTFSSIYVRAFGVDRQWMAMGPGCRPFHPSPFFGDVQVKPDVSSQAYWEKNQVYELDLLPLA